MTIEREPDSDTVTRAVTDHIHEALTDADNQLIASSEHRVYRSPDNDRTVIRILSGRRFEIRLHEIA